MLFRDSSIAEIAVKMIALVFSLSVHEFAHAWSAYKCGDDTAARAGRLTLNPLAHLDLMGTIMILFAPIGWAKPVPVNSSRMRKPRRDDIIVSLAGPGSNLIIATVAGLVFRALVHTGSINLDENTVGIDMGTALAGLLSWLIILNLSLAFFNLIPMFPLDGSHVLENLLPLELQMKYLEIRHYMPFILLVLIVLTPVLSYLVLWPVGLVTPLLSGLSLEHLWSLFQFIVQ